MTRRIVIADAGPLIALARIESLYLMQRLFGRVTITVTVRNEIMPSNAAFADAKLFASTLAEGWVDLVDAPIADYKPTNPGIHAGEASSIKFACDCRELGDNVLILMDDRAGRFEARSRGLAVLGSAALIGLAKTEGLIPAARPLLEKLVESGYFIGPSIVSAVLVHVGE